MPRTRRLLRNEITYSAAKEQESNILHQLGYHDQQTRFFADLDDRRDWMKVVAAHHLGLRSSDGCHVADQDEWLHGSFNVCVPITIDAWGGKRVLIRFPLPYRVGENTNPGNSDEKIRCEAGTYAWLQQECPDVPIPLLYGFGLSSGETFTRVENLPFFLRLFQSIRRSVLSWLRYPPLSNYARHQFGRVAVENHVSAAGYLVVEFIEPAQGAMLSNTWAHSCNDKRLRANLFRSLSRIYLNLCRIRLPRIGSFVIDNDGNLRLENRPLSVEIPQLENEHIPTHIPRDFTYSTTDSYVVDILAFHDSRFRHQPNAVNNIGDCGYQLAALSAMRTVSPSFIRRGRRRGPFSFVLTDLHQSNIFVDADWNITCLVDLEWACSRPIEMVNPPYWLTNKGVDELDSTEYNSLRTEFMESLATEEKNLGPSLSSSEALPRLSDIMNETWDSGAFWYMLALSSPSGLFTIFSEHIRPLFCADYVEEFHLIMAFLWEKNVGYIAGRKLSDKEQYDRSLRQAFEDD